MRHLFIKAVAFIIAYTFFTAAVFAGQGKYTAFQVTVTGKGQPIILIPGASCSGDEWKETVAHLSGKYQCHVLTLAGYAGTPALANGPYLETFKTQIKQYIADEKLEHVILIGHSIGGFLSLCIACEMGAPLEKVLAVDALPFFALTQNPNASNTFSETQAQKMLAIYDGMDEKGMMANQMTAAKFLCRDSTRWATIAGWGAKSDKKTFAYTLTEMMTNDIRKKISSIKVPVLVLAAYCKMPSYPGYTRESVVKTFTDQYEACKTCTIHTTDDNARHFIMYDALEWYYAEVDKFLASKP